MPVLKYLDRATQGTGRCNGKPSRPVRREDADLIGLYVTDEQVRKGITEATAKVSAQYLCMFARETETPFKDLTTPEVMKVVARFRSSMKPNTLRRFLSIFRGFVRYLNDEGYNTALDLEKVNTIRPPKINLETKKASQMLDRDDIIQLIQSAKTSRDRALIAFIYEGALRPVEAAEAKWEDIVFDKYGAQFTTNQKTGKSRYIRLIWSAPYLLQWKNDYQGDVQPDSPVFLSLKKGTPLTVSGVKQAITQVAKRAGLEKHVHAYLLRHSRITSLIVDEVPDSIVKMQCWGDISSRMLACYAHIAPKDIDRILLTRAGIEIEDADTDTSLKARQCPNCGIPNPPTFRFCHQCGHGLTDEAKAEVGDAETELRTIMAADPITLLEAAREIEAAKAGRQGAAVQAPEQARPPAEDPGDIDSTA